MFSRIWQREAKLADGTSAIVMSDAIRLLP